MRSESLQESIYENIKMAPRVPQRKHKRKYQNTFQNGYQIKDKSKMSNKEIKDRNSISVYVKVRDNEI